MSDAAVVRRIPRSDDGPQGVRPPRRQFYAPRLVAIQVPQATTTGFIETRRVDGSRLPSEAGQGQNTAHWNGLPGSPVNDPQRLRFWSSDGDSNGHGGIEQRGSKR